ncbi:histone-lysine N-methyltransferase SETMAR-like [Octopus sinensis]|uniref:Histone-lysine N-methyltransferase SETMAR-like n=1 Tax=Octopus sinensis TaxID=2607531 RepID=A0A6P7SFA3_9MOLL|nr:histone-lysine N-methyltransferase SETMAR-like [Octopus sinensis]
MKQEEMRLLFLHEFKLGHNASLTAANINRAWAEGSTSDHTVRWWFEKFRSGDESLEDQEGRGRPSTLDDQHLKTIVEENPRQSVRKMSHELGVSVSTLSDHLKKIGKVKKPNKWVPQ